VEHTLIKKDEVPVYAESVIKFNNNQMSDDRFTAFRLQHGVYGQRQDGVHMIRVKVPGGLMSDKQFGRIADVLEKHSEDTFASITTRQDIQLHFIPLSTTAAVLSDLAEVGLTTREACGNTVRNVTACTLAGVCPQEHTDVNVFLQSVTQHFLRHPLTQHLPRKFKMSFSGCETDCAQGLIHDLAVIAVKQGEEYGLKILVGGGLGHKQREAIVVEEFLPERDLLACVEAVIGLHHRYSDRKKRAKSRIKFLVDRFGAEGFIEKYKQEFSRTKQAFEDKPYVVGEWHQRQVSEQHQYVGAPRQTVLQKQQNLYAIPVSLSLGDLTVSQIRNIVTLMQDEGLEELRVTQDQNLVLVNVPQSRVDIVEQGLRALQHKLPTKGDDVVACPGTWTCRLGITASREVAKIATGGDDDLQIRVSGCHNGCAQPYVGDIGLHGEGRRKFGKLLPFYRMHFGGNGRLGQRYALKGPEVPAARVVQAMDRVKVAYADEKADYHGFSNWAYAKGQDFFKQLLLDLSEVSESDVVSLAQDHGDATTFKVEQFGGGECAGITQETLDANFAEIVHEKTYRNTFSNQNMEPEAVECAERIIQLSLENLLFVAGKKNPNSELEALLTALIDTPTPKGIYQTGKKLSMQLEVIKHNYTKAVFTTFADKQNTWLEQVEQYCRNWESQQPAKRKKPGKVKGKKSTESTELSVVDLSTETCPMHYVKARMALKSVDQGDVLPIRVQQGEATRLVAESLTAVGYQIEKQVAEDEKSTTLLYILHPQSGIQGQRDSATVEEKQIAV